jgi:LAO/AO transport system kinase
MAGLEGVPEFSLNVVEGVERPPTVNPYLRRRPAARALTRVEDYVEGIRAGDRVVLARAITLVESQNPVHRALAEQVVQACLPASGRSIRIGITGVPGVGKSTFIESLGVHLHDAVGRKVAVLAVDPSSQRSKGSILGDKTRMEELGKRADVFIRPSPSASSLGGVAEKTRETVLLCEAAGFDTLLIETVGVGQSETTVHGMVDFFLLLMLAGAGDELQGIKRGIMEMADGLVITKADGDNALKAERARVEYQTALHLFPANPLGWTPRTLTCSSVENRGIPAIWEMIAEYEALLKADGHWEAKRREQVREWMRDSIFQSLEHDFYEDEAVRERLGTSEAEVVAGNLSPFQAARELLALYHRDRVRNP